MRVDVDFRPDRRRRTFRYRLCRHDDVTPWLPAPLVDSSVLDLRELPIEHTVRYEMEVDYGNLGQYRSANVSSGWGLMDALWELDGVVWAMAYNPFAKPRLPEAVRVQVTVREGSRDADIEALTLDAPVYRPGETVTGTLRIRPFREERTSRPVRFVLPDDLPEGTYTLEACDGYAASVRLRQEQPHRFDPETQRELFAVLQRVAAPRLDRLYLRLPLPEEGLAIGEQELPALPPSRAALLQEANVPDVMPFRRALVRSRESEYVLSGSASASFEVRRRPEGIRLTGRAERGEE
jgi:hypothetical protein